MYFVYFCCSVEVNFRFMEGVFTCEWPCSCCVRRGCARRNGCPSAAARPCITSCSTDSRRLCRLRKFLMKRVLKCQRERERERERQKTDRQTDRQRIIAYVEWMVGGSNYCPDTPSLNLVQSSLVHSYPSKIHVNEMYRSYTVYHVIYASCFVREF